MPANGKWDLTRRLKGYWLPNATVVLAGL